MRRTQPCWPDHLASHRSSVPLRMVPAKQLNEDTQVEQEPSLDAGVPSSSPQRSKIAALTALLVALTGLIGALTQSGILEKKEPFLLDRNIDSPQGANSDSESDFAGQIVGAWTWDGLPCVDGPTITLHEGKLTFKQRTAPTFVHRIETQGPDNLRSRVLSPADQQGQAYEFTLDHGRLIVQTGPERHVWTKCN